MRIAFLNPSGQLGGSERLLLDIVSALRKEKPSWELHLISGEDGPLIQEAASRGANPHLFTFPSSIATLGDAYHKFSATLRLVSSVPAVLSYERTLRTSLSQIRPDILHSNGLKMHIFAARTGLRPLLWHVHDYVSLRPLTRRLLNSYRSNCDAIVANSESVEEDCRQSIKSAVRILTVRNAIDLDRFTPEGASLDLDRLSGFAPTDGIIRIGLVSTFARWKGHNVFLESLSRIPRELPFRAYIIGGAVYQTERSQWSLDELRELARKHRVEDRVGFTGFITKPEEAIRALDIVVHASTRPEPFGLVVAEAMSSGRAVIATSSGGIAEILDPGNNALTVSPNDASALADQMKLLIVNEGLRKQLGEAGKVTAQKLFQRSRLATELIPLYEELSGNWHKTTLNNAENG